MNVVFVSSEVVPFAKTGGLADVAGALPPAIAARGHRVSVVMPLYDSARAAGRELEPTGTVIPVEREGGTDEARFFRTPMGRAKGSAFYFVENPRFFGGRKGLYGTPEGDYPDNDERFVFFCKAVAAWMDRSEAPIDIVHVNDWQSALLPAYMKLHHAGSPALGESRSILTIHNLAYQGAFPAERFGVTGLPAEYYRPEGGLEFWGKVSFLKGGLLFADAITTVSRRYAEEIQTEEFGAGLDGVLRPRAAVVTGIQNGIDKDEWNPATDPHLPANYSVDNLAGKKRCKAALQRECGLDPEAETPLFGMISRLADQKGLDLLMGVLEKRMPSKYQLVLLGTGEEKYHELLAAFAKRRRKRVSVHLKFDNGLAHRIEAGADIFLMPSRYEPSGLNQLYSLRYGTVPLVRTVGGLADTVTDCTDETRKSGRATGFRFDEYSVDAFAAAWKRALALFGDRRAWNAVVRAGMRQDWSWEHSAGEYEKLYEKTRAADRALLP